MADVKKLLEDTGSADAKTAQDALKTLQGIAEKGGADGKAAIKECINGLSGGKAAVVSCSAFLLGVAANKEQDINDAVPALTKVCAKALGKPEFVKILQFCTKALSYAALSKVEHDLSPAFPQLVDALSDKDANVRLFSAMAVGNASSKKDGSKKLAAYTDKLVAALKDEDQKVRGYLNTSLSNIIYLKDKAARSKAIDGLINTFRTDDVSLKMRAQTVLLSAAKPNVPGIDDVREEMIKKLADTLQVKDFVVSIEAANTLVDFADAGIKIASAVPALKIAQQSAHGDLAKQATKALQKAA